MLKITKIAVPDLDKYKTQKNVRRRHISVPVTYETICVASDQDADGMHIRGLLLSMARKYLPWLLEDGKILEFRTPLICLCSKGDRIEEYFFTFDEFNEYQKNHDISKKKVNYYKGLGSWSSEQLQGLIEKIGLDKFLVPFELDENGEEVILNWFLDERVDYRKEQLMSNTLNIAVL